MPLERTGPGGIGDCSRLLILCVRLSTRNDEANQIPQVDVHHEDVGTQIDEHGYAVVDGINPQRKTVYATACQSIRYWTGLCRIT